MPVAVSPDETFSFVLIEDRNKPKDQQRTLICQFLSAREERRFLKAISAAMPSATNPLTLEELADNCVAAIKHVLVGVSGFPDVGETPVDQLDLRDLLTRADLIDIRDSLPSEMTVLGVDKKNSAWLSRSISAKSAE